MGRCEQAKKDESGRLALRCHVAMENERLGFFSIFKN